MSNARWWSALAIAGWLAIAPATAQNPAEATTPRLTIDRLYSLPHLIGTKPTGAAWSRDGRSLAFLWSDAGENFRDVWVVDVEATDPKPRRVTRLPQTDPLLGASDPAAAAARQERFERDPGATRVLWHPNGKRLLVSFDEDLWTVETDGSPPVRLTESAEPELQPAYSADGRELAFLKDGDLWTVPANGSGQAPTRRTHVSEPGVGLRSYRWSAVGRRLAVLRADATEVPERSIPDYLTEEPELRNVRRAYPGEEMPSLSLGWLDLDAVEAANDGDGVLWLNLSAERSAAPDLILGYTWSPDGRFLAIDTSDIFAKERIVLVADVERAPNAPPRGVARDRDAGNETFYFWRIAWSLDSRLLYFLSDRRDDFHVWAVEPDADSAARQLTSGPWAVAQMHPVEGGLVVVGNRPRPEERQLFWVDDAGGEPRPLSRSTGTHAPTVSPTGAFAAVEFSSDTSPPELLLTSLRGERREIPLTDSPLDEFDAYRWVKPSYVTFRSHADGTELHGRLTLPPDFDPERTYPAILGSVYTDSVRNQWGGRTAHPTWGLDQYLAQEGYVLLNVDMRGSWGRGRDHRRGIRLDYGGMDIEDLESGVRHLGTLGFVDLDRVGIWGSSYGGLMTAMSLFRKPGLYAAGVAGAPATNVRHALSGQMAVMMRPEDSPAEYDDSSPYLHANGLEDALMIIHGMRDRVVLFKDSVVLVQRLLLLDKDVDLVALPNAGHGWDNEGLAQTRFAFRKLIQHFDRHLAAGEETP